jgi:hypothetical protein
MSNLYYFAIDGSYGQWIGGSLLADVSDWTEEDWQMIEDAGDSFRAEKAFEIEMKYTRKTKCQTLMVDSE